MKFPKLSKPSLRRVSMQNFSGGLNLSMPENLINANEQSEINNMFFMDGVLKKRPSFEKSLELFGFTVSDIETKEGLFIYKHQTDEYGCGLFENGFVNKNGEFISLPSIALKEEYETELDNKPKTFYCCFPFLFNQTLYLGMGFKHESGSSLYKLYKYSENEFKLIDDSEIYAPLVLINGKGNKFSSLPIGDNAVYSPQVSFEGINLLTNRVRASYTTDGASFSFPFLTSRKVNTPVRVKLVGSFLENGETKEYDFTINNENDIVKIPNTDVVCFVSNYKNLTFRNSDNTAHPVAAALFSNNLELEYYIEENPNTKSFFEMSISTCFGATKTYGGNRLFIAGNKSEENLLRWSDLNNPLYFPENNFAYVSSGKIMSLQKQGNMLLIFSDTEIHYATYLSNSISSEQIITGSVPDVTAVSALFPITQLHSNIGLYSKNSVFLFDNKIIFLANDKKLYKIDSSKTITHISNNIDKFLKENDITYAACGRYLNYLLLATNLGIIAYNTENHGFYIWEDFINATAITKSQHNPVIVAEDGIFVLSDNQDFEFGFTTFETDLFYPDKHKKLSKIYINGNGGEISVITNNAKPIMRKIIKDKPIFLNIPKTQSFKFKLKNCNNLKSIIFYYNLY